jgi:hypothetical protein
MIENCQIGLDDWTDFDSNLTIKYWLQTDLTSVGSGSGTQKRWGPGVSKMGAYYETKLDLSNQWLLDDDHVSGRTIIGRKFNGTASGGVTSTAGPFVHRTGI